MTAFDSSVRPASARTRPKCRTVFRVGGDEFSGSAENANGVVCAVKSLIGLPKSIEIGRIVRLKGGSSLQIAHRKFRFSRLKVQAATSDPSGQVIGSEPQRLIEVLQRVGNIDGALRLGESRNGRQGRRGGGAINCSRSGMASSNLPILAAV